jgi:hypothetical protein
MTRQEELVWAAAWALGLHETDSGYSLTQRRKHARAKAAIAVGALREEADDPMVRESDDWAEEMLRQMAGEPNCFTRRRPDPQRGAVYIMCQHPQVEAADHCHRCAAFGGWPEEESDGASDNG